MKYLFISFFALTLLGSICAKGQSYCELKEYHFYPNKKITYRKDLVNHTYELSEGKSIVFEYLHFEPDDPGNFSYTPTKLAFEIDQNLKSFELRDDEIKKHQGLMMQLFRCPDRKIHFISEGVIKGTLQDDGHWLIELDVVVIGRTSKKSYRFQTSEIFKQPVSK